MLKNNYNSTLGDNFEINEYLKTTEDAALRTRWITIILVVATVIVFVGFYNSTKLSWAYYRLISVYDNESISGVNTSKDQPYPLLDVFFGDNDFVDMKVFACRIYKEGNLMEGSQEFAQNKTARLSKYLFVSFNHKTKNLLTTECIQETRLSDSLKNSLTRDLDRVLKDKFLFDEKLAGNITLRPETKKYLELKKSREKQTPVVERAEEEKKTSFNEEKGKLPISDLIIANRLFLEDAFPVSENASETKDGIFQSRNIVPTDVGDESGGLSPIEKRRLHRQYETVRAYVDNIQYIKIPFFGIAIDVNDLGLIGGASLTIILLLFRFSLSREIKNLNVSFKESFFHNQLSVFYHTLAMRQVLTVPNMDGETRNEALSICSKIVCLLPLFVMAFGVVYDIISVGWLQIYEYRFVNWILYGEIGLLIFIARLSLKCVERQVHIDDIWDDYWQIIKSGKSADILMDSTFDLSQDNEMKRIVNIRLKRETNETGWWLFNLIKRFPGYFWYLVKLIVEKNWIVNYYQTKKK